jgi:flagellar motility protein MotE (MotC chaperone)
MKGRVILAALALLLLVLPVFAQTLVDEDQITSVEERRILVSIEQEYEKLEQREADLDSRELQLKTLQAEVDKKLAAMQKLREELVKLLNRKQEEEGIRVGELSKIYEKMEPRKAARLIKELDTQLAIELLIGIKKKTAGQILDSLDAETATKLSKAFTDIPVKDRSGY